jgi:hypothetical protein
LERADRKIAHDIVDGVIHFRRHPPDAEELERLGGVHGFLPSIIPQSLRDMPLK